MLKKMTHLSKAPEYQPDLHPLLHHHHHRQENPLKSHNACIPQANLLPHQSTYNYSTSNQDKKHSKAQNLQGKDGFGNGRRGIFSWEGHVDTHYLHNVYTMHALYISLHILNMFKS